VFGLEFMMKYGFINSAQAEQIARKNFMMHACGKFKATTWKVCILHLALQ
jgi:hypothetical protein